MGEEKLQHSPSRGTLAVDLGSTTTVVAFTPAGEQRAQLLDLPPISQRPGEIPSLIWSLEADPLLGHQVLEGGFADRDDPRLIADFKRRIGADERDRQAEQAGQALLTAIWARLPQTLTVERLVLTAPVETYRQYRRWLLDASQSLPVNEVALVDEPTAAALGAGLPPALACWWWTLGAAPLISH